MVSSVVLGSITGISLASNITQSLILSSIHSSYSLMKNFATKKYARINEVVEEFDLIAKMEIIEALMKDIEKECQEKESIKKALGNLHIVMDNIHKILQHIDGVMEEHNKKYFSYWRSVCYDTEVYELKKQIKLMDLRYNMFLEILKVR
jgi:hypothetical protein